jgi:hypothetical protein
MPVLEYLSAANDSSNQTRDYKRDTVSKPVSLSRSGVFRLSANGSQFQSCFRIREIAKTKQRETLIKKPMVSYSLLHYRLVKCIKNAPQRIEFVLSNKSFVKTCFVSVILFRLQ